MLRKDEATPEGKLEAVADPGESLAIGRNQARCPYGPGLLSPPFKPCMPISGTRLTDGLLMWHSRRPGSGSSRPIGVSQATRSGRGSTTNRETAVSPAGG